MGNASYIRSFAKTGGYLIEKEEYNSFGNFAADPEGANLSLQVRRP